MIDTFTPLYKASIQQDTQLLSERMIPTFTDDTKKSDHDSLHHVLFSVNQFQINITQLKSNAVKNTALIVNFFILLKQRMNP